MNSNCLLITAELVSPADTTNKLKLCKGLQAMPCIGRVSSVTQCAVSQDFLAVRKTASVYHASVMTGCMPVSGTPLKAVGIPMKTACMQTKQSLFSISVFFYYLLYVFVIVLNCIMQNNSYCFFPVLEVKWCKTQRR